jgi:HNH endonuclease
MTRLPTVIETEMMERRNPAIGTVSHRYKEGLKGKQRIVWMACPDCGTERWASFEKPEVPCRPCARQRRAPLATLTRDELHRLYHEELLEQSEIAQRFGVEQTAVSWRMRTWKIPARDCRDPHRLAEMSERFSGANNPRWVGGRTKDVAGYVLIRARTHPRSTQRGYVREHILVWEKQHGKPLPDGWDVHHLNGVKDDNRPENLEALPSREHRYIIAMFQAHIRGLEAEIRRLKNE